MKKKIVRAVSLILAFIFLLGIIGCFQQGNTVSGVVCVFLTALFVFLAFRPSSQKQTSPAELRPSAPAAPDPVPIQTSPRTAPAVSAPIQTPPSPTPSPDGMKEKRKLFIEKKKNEFAAAISAIPRSEIVLSDAPAVRVSLENMPDFKSRNITRATRLETLFPLVVLDVETTGIKLRGSEIIEVSAIKYEDGFHPVSCFTTLTKPKKPIPPEASAINNITDDMVANCPPFSAVADSFSAFIEGCNIAGHNLIDFDLRFLFVQGVRLSEKVKYFDTLDLAKLTLTAEGKKKFDHHSGEYVEADEWDVEDYKLETLCDYYGIFRDDAHRSLSDCYATGLVFQRLIEDKTE